MALRTETREQVGLVPPYHRRYDVAPQGVVLHWPGAASAFRAMSHDQHRAIVRDWQAQHMARGSNDLEYGSVLCSHGIWMQARTEARDPMVRVGSNGTADANTRYTSIQLMLGTAEGITGEEVAWAGQAVAWLRGHGWGPDLRPHSDFTATACPGDAIRAAIPAIDAAARNPTAPTEPEDTMTHQVIFFTYQGSRYAAYPLAGVYRRIPDPATETSILNSIGRCGGSVLEWHETKEVDNPAAFGVEID